jgi:MFS transporter, ACS family, glucarate transporter
MLTRIVVWWSVMTALTGWATGFASLFFIRLLFGIGEAGCFPSAARAYARWLPVREHGRAFGLAVMTGAFGGALTQRLVVWMLAGMSWRHTFPIFGVVGLLWAVAWYWWFRDDPHRHAGVNPAELELIGSDPPAPQPAVPWRAVCANRTVWLVCLMYFGVIYGWYFFLTWMPTYLLRARGFNLNEVGWLAMLPLLGIGGGVALGGWLSDVLTRQYGARFGRRLLGVAGLPLAAAAIVVAVMTPAPITAALALSCAAGFAALGVAGGWALCLEIGGQHAGVISGAMNTFGNLGGALSPVVVGVSLQKWNSWNAPLLTVAGCYILAALCWLAIDPLQRLEDQ